MSMTPKMKKIQDRINENMGISEPSQDDKPHEHWRVEVSTFGEQIVAIETEMVAGREISDKDQATIELCARHLLGFIGK